MKGPAGGNGSTSACAACGRSVRGEKLYEVVEIDSEETMRIVGVCFGCRQRVEIEGHWRVGDGPESVVYTAVGCAGCG